MTGLFIFFAVLAGVVWFGVLCYNKLVRGRNQYKNAFSQIDVQLQRRYDLIPNLVETAKAYLNHERETLEQVTQARNQAQSSLSKAKASPDDVSIRQLFKDEQVFESALSRLMMVAEAYPDLKANQTMMQLNEELSTTENKVSFARQAYNDAVMSYNNLVEQVPTNFFAGMFGHTQAPLFEVTDKKAHQAVKVSFN